MEVQSILSKFKVNSRCAGRPPAVVEIAPRGVLAASLPLLGQTPTYAFQALVAGTVVPGIEEPNLRPPETVTDAVRSTMEKVSSNSRAVTIVLPDATTRVFMLEFDDLPENVDDAVAILRFRLRKVVPFDVENARISYQMLPPQGTKCRVLVAVIPGPVHAEYEAAVHAAGYEPGAVLPTGLAALAALNSSDPVLSASLSEMSLTTSITNSDDILLYRTHVLSNEPVERASEVRRDIAVAVAYFEDKLMTRPQCLHYAGIGTAEEFASSMPEPELAVVDLAPRPRVADGVLPEDTNIAGVTGALAGAR
jgi:type IV pilus assembly protein PilM